MTLLNLHTALALSSLILGASGLGAGCVVGLVASGFVAGLRHPLQVIGIFVLVAALYIGCAVAIWPRSAGGAGPLGAAPPLTPAGPVRPA